VFVLIPWKVDVPQDRWPLMNWLIIVALIAVFAIQVADMVEYATSRSVQTHDTRRPGLDTSQGPANGPKEQESTPLPGITGEWILRGWSLKGLFGYMWLHSGLFHLAGNLLFLWIFGNAVCAKLGNLPYLALYVLCGVVAGIAQLLCVSGPALGASGAINGVVGMYLVLFFENEITCLFAMWILIPFYIRWFAVSSIWIILLWLSWDILGALWGSSHVAYSAHLGGFAAGFGIVMLLCAKGWITMERYEKSLWQRWQERKGTKEEPSFSAEYARLGLSETAPEQRLRAPARPADIEPTPLPSVEPTARRRVPIAGESIRTVCACGRDIQVSRQYAGKTVRCPACNQYVVIPQTTDFFGPPAQETAPAPPLPVQARDPSIRFVCSCGKHVRVPAKYAGRFGRCPQCGVRLRIPPAIA